MKILGIKIGRSKPAETVTSSVKIVSATRDRNYCYSVDYDHLLISASATKEDISTYLKTIDKPKKKTVKRIDGVWREIPMMEETVLDSAELDQIAAYITEWGNPYPTAHEKKMKKV